MEAEEDSTQVTTVHQPLLEEVRNGLNSLSADDAASVILDALCSRPQLALPVISGACPQFTFAPASLVNSRRMVGRIKSFSATNGYGFVTCKEVHDQFGCDVFIHKVQFAGFSVGQDVNFAVFLNKDKRPQAFDIVALASSASPGTLSEYTGASSSSSSPSWPCHEGARKKAQPESPSAHSLQIGCTGGAFSPSNVDTTILQERLLHQRFYACHGASVWPRPALPPPRPWDPWNATSSQPSASSSLPGGRNGAMSNQNFKDFTRNVEAMYRDEHFNSKFHRVLQECLYEERSSQESASSTLDKEGLFYRRFRGKVKSLKSENFGFIDCAELKERFGRDVFVQPSQLENCKVGAGVTFNVILNDKGQPQAHKIKISGIQSSVDDANISEITSVGQIDQVFEGTICIICQEILHRSTSVQPCLHTFCSACLGGWLGRRDVGSRKCPMCRMKVKNVTRNHTLDGLIAGLLKAHPERQRPAQDIHELDKQDILHSVGYELDLMLLEDDPWGWHIPISSDDYDDEGASDDSSPWAGLS